MGEALEGSAHPGGTRYKSASVGLKMPEDAILLESKSANTYQNATRTADVMSRQDLDGVLLVPSPLHMPRALAVFWSAGIRAVPAPTDVQVGDRNHTVLDVLPDAGVLAGSTAAIRE
nr:YdcF family protein [Salinibacter altiplanensis]